MCFEQLDVGLDLKTETFGILVFLQQHPPNRQTVEKDLGKAY